MSYGKKDEDADQAIVKVDRVAVFQEGEAQVRQLFRALLKLITSSTFQLFPGFSAKMSDFAHQNCTAPLYGGVVPSKRSYGPLLWNIQAFPEQGPGPAADDVLGIQGTRELSVRCHYDDSKHHQGHRRRR